MPSGRPLAPRPLADIRADLDAGPEWYGLSGAAAVIGMTATTLNTYAGRGEVLRARDGFGQDYRYHRDELWRFALAAHGLQTNDLRDDGGARAAVLRMLTRWQDCPTTIQQLHDSAHVRPLPPIVEDHGTRKPIETEDVTCPRCGDVYQRPVDSMARYTTCARCTSAIVQRASRLAREFVAWCAQSQNSHKLNV